jgi:hypothetical protein
MKINVLTSLEEPTDKELRELMHAVAQEVKNKFATITVQLNDTIATEIALAQAKFKAKQQ